MSKPSKAAIHPQWGIFQIVPLFGVLLLVYWLAAKVGFFPARLNEVLFQIQLPSRMVWKPTWGDFMIMLGLLTLYAELFKSTRTSEATIIEHLLSTLVFTGYLVVWLIYGWGGNSVFLILATMSFLDVIAGFTITISAARSDLSVGGGKH